MLPSRVRDLLGRAVSTHNRAVRPVAVLLVIGLSCMVAVGDPWLEETIYLPDSFGGLGRPRCMAYDPADNTVYVGGGDCVIAIDGATNQKIARIPNGSGGAALCYNPTNNKLYSASGGGVAIIDCATNSVIGTVDSAGNPICYNRRDNKVYCANMGSRSLTVIDGATDSVMARVATGWGMYGTCYNSTDDKVYVTNHANLTVVD